MNVVLVTQNSSLAHCLLPVLAERYLPKHREMPLTVFVHPNVHLNASFAYPRGMKWAEYPFVGDPVYKPMDLTAWRKPRLTVPISDEMWPETEEERTLSHEDVVARLREADIIVNGMDRGMSGDLVFHRVLECAFPEEPPKARVLNPLLIVLEREDLMRSFDEAENTPINKDRALTYARLRRRFDYCYGVNAFAILGRTMAVAGLFGETVPSKFGLQFLYAIQRSGPLTDGQAVELMWGWKGTGRYPNDRLYNTEFGSYSSRAKIIEQLGQAGLIDRSGPIGATNRLSDAGERFLSLLHPDCEDPDLPFRFDEWCWLPEAEAMAKIDRYIKTFFGKQKRHIDRYKLAFAQSDLSAMKRIDEKVFGTVQENANTKIVFRASEGEPVPRKDHFIERDLGDELQS